MYLFIYLSDNTYLPINRNNIILLIQILILLYIVIVHSRNYDQQQHLLIRQVRDAVNNILCSRGFEGYLSNSQFKNQTKRTFDIELTK